MYRAEMESVLSSSRNDLRLRLRLRSFKVYRFRYRTSVSAFPLFFQRVYSLALFLRPASLVRYSYRKTDTQCDSLPINYSHTNDRRAPALFLSLSFSIVAPRNNEYSLIENDLRVDAAMYEFSHAILLSLLLKTNDNGDE